MDGIWVYQNLGGGAFKFFFKVDTVSKTGNSLNGVYVTCNNKNTFVPAGMGGYCAATAGNNVMITDSGNPYKMGAAGEYDVESALQIK